MPSQVDNLTTATATTAQALGSNKQVRYTFVGTFAGVSGKPQASNDGTNFVDVPGNFYREDTGAAFNGQIGAANFSIVGNVGGFSYVRFNATALGSGTVTVQANTGTNLASSPGTQTISLNTVGQTITSAAAGALAVGPNGATNPSLNVDASAGSAATGLNIAANAAASGLALSVISSGANEPLSVDAKGSGTITLGGTSTGAITLGRATGVTGALTVTSAGAAAAAVGANGSNNPVLKVDASTASVATGVSVTGAAAGGRVAIAAISSSTNEGIDLDAKGSGTVRVGNSSTGNVLLGGGGGVVVLSGTLTGGGLLTCALQVATSGPLIYSGSGVPTISAAVKGSIYLRTDGSSTSTRLYVATDTAGTWTGVTTAA